MTRTPGVPPYAERGGSNSSPRACWPPRWEQFRRAVLARLDPGVRAKTRGNVEAAALLDAMNSPQERLPHWRIVEPPPPPVLLGHYRYAARRIGAPWTYLAAIHLVETRMGRIRGVSSAGAQGPMQFLPTTWDIYGGGGTSTTLVTGSWRPRDSFAPTAHPTTWPAPCGTTTPRTTTSAWSPAMPEQLQRSALAYRGYWHWRVLYKHVRGTYLLDHGYPEVPARPLG